MKKIYPAYVSKHTSEREKQIILLMIPKHHHAIKKLFALLREVKSKHDSDFYCLNFLHSYRTKNKLELHKEEYANKDFGGVGMLFEENIMLKFTQYLKPIKEPSLNYVDLESLIKKYDDVKIIQKNHLQQK